MSIGWTEIIALRSDAHRSVLVAMANSRMRGCVRRPHRRPTVTSFIQFDGLPTTLTDQVFRPLVMPSQYTALRYVERRLDVGAIASIGLVGDSHANAIAETVMDLHKTECLKIDGPSRTADALELATHSWAH